MSNEEKKKKVSEEDLSTLSGGCGKKEEPRKPKYKAGDKVWCNLWQSAKCTIIGLIGWDNWHKDFIYWVDLGDGQKDDLPEYRLSPRYE